MREARDVPTGWSLVRLRSVLRRRTERARGHETLLSVTQGRGVIRQDEVGRRDSSNDDKANYWRVEPGDIVYNTMRMWQGVAGRSELPGIVSPAYTVCEPTAPIDTRFLAYLFKTPASVAEFYRLSQGLVSDTWSLRFSAFANLEFILPPLPEQRRITEIFDALDSHISAVDHLIDKLRARHHGLTESLLTRSVAKNAPLESYLLRPPKNGFSPKEVDEWTGLRAIGLGCLTPDGFSPRQLKNVPLGDARNKNTLLEDGDLLMSRANTRDLVGLAGIYRDIGGPCIFPDLVMRLTPASSCRSEYLELLLRGNDVRRQIQAIAQGTSETMVKINGSSVQQLQLGIPPLVEQDRVLGIVATSSLEIESCRKERGKLSLLKQGLMEDLLTGQIRISEAEAVMESS